jgi:hypothetical protein
MATRATSSVDEEFVGAGVSATVCIPDPDSRNVAGV